MKKKVSPYHLLVFCALLLLANALLCVKMLATHDLINGAFLALFVNPVLNAGLVVAGLLYYWFLYRLFSIPVFHWITISVFPAIAIILMLLIKANS